MKPEEAIKFCEEEINGLTEQRDGALGDVAAKVFLEINGEERIETLRTIMGFLTELKQYREIGTVEECREAVEKQKPKKPRILVSRGGKGGKYCICPRCEAVTGKHIHFCRLCGQAIDWSNEE